MGSSRLPGKVLLKANGNHPMLYFVLKQIQYSKMIEDLVVSTTTLEEDDVIVKYVESLKIKYFRGKSDDVLDRYYQCAKEFSFDSIVRITSDCPLIDPEIVDHVILKYKNGKYDYVTNYLPRTFPIGMGVEVFSFNALKIAWKNAELPSEREHITPYFSRNKDKFKMVNVESTENLAHIRLTLDRTNDLKLIRIIISKLKQSPIRLVDIRELLRKEPDLISINKGYDPNEGYLKSLSKDEDFLKKYRKPSG